MSKKHVPVPAIIRSARSSRIYTPINRIDASGSLYGGGGAVDPIFEVSTDGSGARHFVIKDGSTEIMRSWAFNYPNAYPATHTFDVAEPLAPVTLGSRNTTDTLATIPQFQTGTTFSRFYHERYDDLNQAVGAQCFTMRRDTTVNGVYVFGDLTITKGSSGDAHYIKYETTTDGMIAYEQWSPTASVVSSGTFSWPLTGTAPTNVVGVSYANSSYCIATQRTSTPSTTGVNFQNNRVANAFAQTNYNYWYSFYSKGVYTATYGNCEIECGVGFIKFKIDGDVKRVIAGGTYGGSGSRVTLSLPTTMINNPFPIAGWCTSTPSRNLPTYDPINGSQFYLRTYQWATTSSQSSEHIAMDIKGS